MSGHRPTELAAKGAAAKTRSTLETRVNRIVESIGAERFDDISASGVRSAIAGLADEDELGARTQAHYLRAIKQFSRWMRRD